MTHSALNPCVLSKTVMSVLLPPPTGCWGCNDGRQWFIGPTVYEAKQRHCVRKTRVHMRIGKNTTPLTRHFGHICKNTQPFSRETNSRNTRRIAAAYCQFWPQTWQFQVPTRNHNAFCNRHTGVFGRTQPTTLPHQPVCAVVVVCLLGRSVVGSVPSLLLTLTKKTANTPLDSDKLTLHTSEQHRPRL